MAQLMDYKFNNGLPFNLTGAEGERKPINHGFKAVQIGISAWTAEALKNTMPASVFFSLNRMSQPRQSEHGHHCGS